MEEVKLITISELLKFSRPLTAASALCDSSTSEALPSAPYSHHSKKQKIGIIDNVQTASSINEKNSRFKVISSLNHPLFLSGILELPNSSSKDQICWKDGCLVFSDGTSKVCCAILRPNANIIGENIRVVAWNFIPFKCNGGLLEIIQWEFLNQDHNTYPFNSVLRLSLYHTSKTKQGHCFSGRLISVSPLLHVPCTIQSHRLKDDSTSHFIDKGHMRGFLAELLICSCSACDSEGQHQLHQQHIIIYFCGLTSSWHPLLVNMLYESVSIVGLKKKLISVGSEVSHQVFTSTENCTLSLSQTCQKCMPVDRVPVSQNGEMGHYRGIITGVYMQGMLIELDNEVWLLLADSVLCPPHFLRIGAIVSLSNVHFVWPNFSWEKMLLLGACLRTTVGINFFSPLETPCYFRSQKYSLLGKFIESLTYSAMFWVLLTVSSFKQKFVGIMSEHTILGSKRKEGFVQFYAKSYLPPRAFCPKHQALISFCKHESCSIKCESSTKSLELVVPISTFISICESRWIHMMKTRTYAHVSAMEDGDIGLSENVTGGAFIRLFISSQDFGAVLMGSLQL